MRVLAVMAEIAQALETIPGLQVFPHPADSITPPTAEVLFPDIEFDRAFQRGLARMQGGIIVSVGRQFDEAAVANLAKYADPEDSVHSVHAALHNRTVAEAWTSCAYARVVRAYGYDRTIGDLTFVAYRFDVDIAGRGTA